jgi:hypothetical protein
MKPISKVNIRWFLALIFCVLLIVPVLASDSASHLSDVLSSSKASRASFDFNYLLIGFVALSLTTLSFAKGYEIFTRGKDRKEKQRECTELEILKEENDRLIKTNAAAMRENDELKRAVARLEESFREKSAQEESLLRNIAGLKKEFERLNAEKQKLLDEKGAEMLRLSQCTLLEAPKAAVEPEPAAGVKIEAAEARPAGKKKIVTVKAKKKAPSALKPKRGGKK